MPRKTDKVTSEAKDVYKVRLNKNTIRIVVYFNGSFHYYPAAKELASYQLRSLEAVNCYVIATQGPTIQDDKSAHPAQKD